MYNRCMAFESCTYSSINQRRPDERSAGRQGVGKDRTPDIRGEKEMKKEEFYYDSRDNQSRIHAVRYTPEDQEPVCVVQIIHGMAEYFERYEEFARFLTQRGCIVTGNDHLGHGKSVGEDGVYGYFCEQDPATVVVRDVHRLKKMTQQSYPALPYIIIGHSMGSFILRNYLTMYGSGISGAVIMGTGYQTKGAMTAARLMVQIQKLFLGSKHVSRFCDKISFGSYNKRIPDAKTAYDWLSKNEESVQKYIDDPLCGNIFTLNGFQTLTELIMRAHDPERLKKIPAGLPLMVISGDADPLGEYGEGIPKVCEGLRSVGVKDVEMHLCPTGRHELLNEPEREEIMEVIYEWIKKHCLASCA